ncbi:MAG: NfeD family protein [Chloroflexi bacterium]|nr:NfeD family protein [Chloroflexota bacterium]MBU1752050.1 NfeD family protein [Chloroflexota bacterium]
MFFCPPPSTLDCLYFMCLTMGGMWAGFMALFGLVDFDLPFDLDFDHDIDLPIIGDLHFGEAMSFDHGEIGVSPISPATISVFVASFGGVGIIATKLFNVPGEWSIIIAGAGALVIAAGVFLFYSQFLIASQSSSDLVLSELAGRSAEVTAPIPGAGQLGEIAYVSKGARYTASARSADGSPIARGTSVVIEEASGSVFIVRPK